MQMPAPDARILARRGAIVAALEAAAPGCVIHDPAETRAYECDALSAYRCPPLAVVLPLWLIVCWALEEAAAAGPSPAIAAATAARAASVASLIAV